MTQTLNPLFGEYSTDQVIGRANGQRPGIVAQPGLSAITVGNDGRYTISITPNQGLGFWGWRTAWTKDTGSFLIVEDADVIVGQGLQEPASGQSRHYLLVGRWKWIAGAIGGDGKPLGTFGASQHAAYELLAGADAATPSDPAVQSLDAAGRPGVVLARIVWAAGSTPTIEWIPETMLDMAVLAAALAGKMNREGMERHIGAFRVSGTPQVDEDVLRKMDLGALLTSQINLGPGSTRESGYAFFGSMVLAWVRGPNTWCTGDMNTRVLLKTPITFDSVFTYALSTEDEDSYIEDNDFWFQMAQPVASGNTFPTVLQFTGGAGGGWAHPILMVWGTSTAAAIAITSTAWNGMAGPGQTYPKIANLRLASTGCLGAATWSVVSTTATAAIIAAGTTDVLQVTLPAVGSYQVVVKVTDGTGRDKTETVTFTLAEYTSVPLVINDPASQKTQYAPVYPYTYSRVLTTSGGYGTVVLSVVAGSDTTLPSAAISGATLTGIADEAGTWTVRVRAVDESSPVQTVERVINVGVETYVEPPICFEQDTWILMGDRTARQFKDVRGGDYVMAVSEAAFLRGSGVPVPELATDVTRREQPEFDTSVVVNGVKSTPGHLYGVRAEKAGTFQRADAITAETPLVVLQGSVLQPTPGGKVELGEPVRVAMNLSNRHKTYFVAASPDGPWMLVHNLITPKDC